MGKIMKMVRVMLVVRVEMDLICSIIGMIIIISIALKGGVIHLNKLYSLPRNKKYK